jgi:hypothetical protein
MENTSCPGISPGIMIEADQISKLNKDLRVASRTLSFSQARFLVDAYYIAQDNRMREDAQIRALEAANEPSDVIAWFAQQSRVLEGQLRAALDVFSTSHRAGEWARSNLGVGPVLAAGLLAYIDIHVAETASNIWSYAGLNPNQKWEKGQKRPWNASLRVVCWKLGQSFMKVSNREDATYGRYYKERKAYEIARNDSGGNREKAVQILTEKKWDKSTETYKHLMSGKLPPAQIDARARRYAVKIFLSHLHQVWRTLEGLPVREPYPIAHLGHAHTLQIDPKWLKAAE